MDEAALAKAVAALAASTRALADAEERWVKYREEESALEREFSEKARLESVRLTEEAHAIQRTMNEVFAVIAKVQGEVAATQKRNTDIAQKANEDAERWRAHEKAAYERRIALECEHGSDKRQCWECKKEAKSSTAVPK